MLNWLREPSTTAATPAYCLSSTFDAVVMSRSEQQDLTAAPTDNQVEVVQHIAPEDAQIRRCGIRNTSELPAHPYCPPILTDKLHGAGDQHKGTPAADSAQCGARWCTPGRQA